MMADGCGFESHPRQPIFLWKMTVSGKLCCFALPFCCLLLLPCLSQHLFDWLFMYMYMGVHVYSCFFTSAEDVIIETGIVPTETVTEIVKDLVIIGTNQDLPLNQLANKLPLLLPLRPLNLINHPPPLLQPPNKTMALLLVPVVIVLVIRHYQVPMQ